MDFKQFVKVLNKYKWLIFLISAVTSAGTFLLIKTDKPKFKSVAQISTGFTDVHEERSENTTNAINSKFSNFEELITSPTVYSMLSYQLFLHDVRNPKPFRKLATLRSAGITNEEIKNAAAVIRIKKDSAEILNVTDPEDKRLMAILGKMGYNMPALTSAITVKRVSSTDFVEVTAITENKNLSAFIVNMLAQEGIKAYNNKLKQNLDNSVSFYSTILEKKKSELDMYLDSLNRMKTTFHVIDYTTETQNKLQKLSTLEMAREQEKQKISSLTQALSSISRNMGTHGDFDRRHISERITVLKDQIHRLNSRYIKSGSADRILADSINSLREELKQETYLYQQSTYSEAPGEDLKTRKINNQIELDIARSNLYAIQKSIDSVQKEVGTFASNETELSGLETAITVTKAEYLEILNKYNKAKNASMDLSRLHVAEHGRPAAKAEASKAILFAIVAGVISFSFTIVILFLLQYFNNKIGTASRFAEMTGLNVLGGINSIKSKVFNVDDVFADQENMDPVKAAFMGNVRQIRYTLEQSNNKVYLFTSNLKGEGKTVALISIAYSIALLKKKVLIIDTNFKNNTITKIFSAKAGIMNFIHSEKKVNAEEHVFADYENAGDAESAESANSPTYDLERVSHTEISNRWIQQITPSPLRGVDVIGCEKSNLSPSEIFAGKPFDKFLEEVKHYYDYIFFEGPALNDYSDSKELSAYSDKVILVVSADRTLNQQDEASFTFLESLKDQFFGCIVNNTNHEDDK